MQNLSDITPSIEKFIRDTIQCDHIEIAPLAGDASNRRYFRVLNTKATYVLMLWEPFVNDDNYPFLSVQKHFRKHGVLVPEVIGVAEKLGVVLLEDLGDLTLERKFWENQDQSLAFPFYQKAIDELIKIHYPVTQDRVPNCTAFKVEFDVEKLLWEMNYARKNLLQEFCKARLTEKEHKILDDTFFKICKTLADQPKTIAHRDYHSRNIMLKRGKARIIDFQDARLGAVQYDLVSLVHDSYVAMNAKLAEQVLTDYIDKANNYRTQKISRAEFDEIFEIQLIQRCFKACGSFSSFFNQRNDQRYLKYLKPTVKKVAQHIKARPELADFYSILSDHGVLDLDFEGMASLRLAPNK